MQRDSTLKSLCIGGIVISCIVWLTNGLFSGFANGFGWGFLRGNVGESLRFVAFIGCLLGVCAIRYSVFMTLTPQFYPSRSAMTFLRDASSTSGLIAFAGHSILIPIATALYSYQSVSTEHSYISALGMGFTAAFIYINNQEYVIRFPTIFQTPLRRCMSQCWPNLISSFRRSFLSMIVSTLFVYLRSGHFYFEGFFLHFMFHFYIVSCQHITQVYLTRPIEPELDDQLDIDTALHTIGTHDAGSFEYLFIQYSRKQIESDHVTSPFRQPAAILTRRYEQVVEVIKNHQDSQVLREFCSSRTSISKELDRCLSFMDLWTAVQHDKFKASHLIKDEAAWTQLFLNCTALTDALTLKLELAADSIRHYTPIPQNACLQLIRQILHMDIGQVNPIVIHFLYHRQKNARYEPFLFDFQQKTNRMAVFGNTQVLVWAIDILAIVVCDSRENNIHGHVQPMIPAILQSFLQCQMEIEAFCGKERSFVRDEPKESRLLKQVYQVLNRAIYRITTTYFSEMDRFTFAPVHAARLKNFLEFRA